MIVLVIMIRSEGLELRVVDLADGHTLHFDQPAGTANGGMDNDIGLVGEALFKHIIDRRVVGCVAEINRYFAHIVESAFRFIQQCLDVFPHALSLLDNVLGIHYLTLVIDAGSTRDKDVTAVLIVDTGTAFETDTIVAGAIQMGRGIEIVNLLLLDATDGIIVHLCQYVRIGLSASDTC